MPVGLSGDGSYRSRWLSTVWPWQSVPARHRRSPRPWLPRMKLICRGTSILRAWKSLKSIGHRTPVAFPESGRKSPPWTPPLPVTVTRPWQRTRLLVSGAGAELVQRVALCRSAGGFGHSRRHLGQRQTHRPEPANEFRMVYVQFRVPDCRAWRDDPHGREQRLDPYLLHPQQQQSARHFECRGHADGFNQLQVQWSPNLGEQFAGLQDRAVRFCGWKQFAPAGEQRRRHQLGQQFPRA